MKIVVVIPGYNEAKYLKTVLNAVKKISPQIVYVDDGSTDYSAKIAQKIIHYVLLHDVNLGKGAAMKTGADFAFNKLGAEAVIFMDSDGQHQAEDLKLFIKKLEEGSEVVFGVRKFSARMPLVRLFGNRLASLFIKALYGQYIPDVPSGFKAFTKKIYSKVFWHSCGYEVETEIAVKVVKNKIPFTTVEIDTIYLDKDKGVTFLDALNTFCFMLQLRLEK